MTEPMCTCEGREMFVCHDFRSEPHLVGCPRWGMPLPDASTHWYDAGGVIPPGLTRAVNSTGADEEVR